MFSSISMHFGFIFQRMNCWEHQLLTGREGKIICTESPKGVSPTNKANQVLSHVREDLQGPPNVSDSMWNLRENPNAFFMDLDNILIM